MEEPTPYGLCECGCGKHTTIAARNDRRTGAVKGAPRRFLKGHSGGAARRLAKVPCAHCGTLIYPLWDSGRPRRFCDRRCYTASRGSFDRTAYQRDWFLRTHYGITSEEWDRILASQGGGCAICHRTGHARKALHVDHDHATGRIRGILCSSCNRGIAYFRDDPSRLRTAAAYLERG